MLQTTLKIFSVSAVGLIAVAQIAGGLSHRAPLSPGQAAPHVAAQRAPARTAITPAAYTAPSSALDEMRIQSNEQGHFFADALINGQSVRVVVDTGATAVALTNEDAASLGIFPLAGDFTTPIRTANGLAYAAPVKLRQVQLGGIELYDVDALVSQPGVLNVTLLGMTFLSRLSNVQMESGALLLRK